MCKVQVAKMCVVQMFREASLKKEGNIEKG